MVDNTSPPSRRAATAASRTVRSISVHTYSAPLGPPNFFGPQKRKPSERSPVYAVPVRRARFIYDDLLMIIWLRAERDAGRTWRRLTFTKVLTACLPGGFQGTIRPSCWRVK